MTRTDLRVRNRPGSINAVYFALMAICIALFVLSWAVIDRYSVLAAVIVSVVALVIPPVAVIVANVASATDRRHP